VERTGIHLKLHQCICYNLETLKANPRKIPIKDPILIAQNEIHRVLKAASPRYNKSLILNPEKYVEG
jgi:hypothetical protein